MHWMLFANLFPYFLSPDATHSERTSENTPCGSIYCSHHLQFFSWYSPDLNDPWLSALEELITRTLGILLYPQGLKQWNSLNICGKNVNSSMYLPIAKTIKINL